MKESPPEKISFRLPRALEVLLALVILLELLAPFLTKMYGIDARRHLLWIAQFSELNSKHVLIPTWVPSGFFGFGSTTFYFYPPLTYYTAAAIYILTGLTNARMLYQIISVLVTIGSFFSARILLRKIAATQYQSTVASILYAVAPLRLFELYNRGALSTHLAYVFLPLIGLGALSIYRNSNRSPIGRVFSLAIPMALLALTSVPLTLSTVICLGIALVVSWRGLSMRVITELALAAVATASLAGYHYASVLAAEPYAHLATFSFAHGPWDILLWLHPGAGTYNLLLIYAIAVIILATYIAARRKKIHLTETERAMVRLSLILSAFVLFLDLSPISYWLWNSAAFQLIQIPWRFYPILLLLSAMVVAAARSIPLIRAAKGIAWLCAVAALLPLAIILSSWHSMERLPAEDIAYDPVTPTTSQMVTMLASHEGDPPVLANLVSGEKIESIHSNPYVADFATTLRSAHVAAFHRFYWPFWHLYANGHEISSHPDSLGRAVAVLPAGNYTAVWRLERTPLEIAGLWISGVTWCGALIFLGIGLVRRRVRTQIASSP